MRDQQEQSHRVAATRAIGRRFAPPSKDPLTACRAFGPAHAITSRPYASPASTFPPARKPIPQVGVVSARIMSRNRLSCNGQSCISNLLGVTCGRTQVEHIESAL